MDKVVKRIGIILGCIVIVIGVLAVTMFQGMKHKTEEAVAKQVNVEIDMNQVKDGIYKGSSDGGMIYAEVEVEVKNHTITDIKLIKHENGKGKPAEAILDEMIARNTDNVDAVSGATGSSKTIRNAVNNALRQGLDK